MNWVFTDHGTQGKFENFTVAFSKPWKSLNRATCFVMNSYGISKFTKTFDMKK